MTKSPKPGRHDRMMARYGFGLFPVPRYREIKGQGWHIRHHLPSMSEGYLTPSFVEGNRFVLYQGRVPWMSTGLFEVESHAIHVHAAHGLVVVAGLGMGMYAYAVSSKPEVERVVIIERDPAVIEMMEEASGFEDWPGRDKIVVLQADALDPNLGRHVAEVTEGRCADYFYADIWPTTPDDSAPEQMRAMTAALKPLTAGWWGQEFNLGQWCLAQGRAVDEAALVDYFAEMAVPVPLSAGYAAFCQDVIAANASLLGRKAAPKRQETVNGGIGWIIRGIGDWWRR